jgi:hypothetical protein
MDGVWYHRLEVEGVFPPSQNTRCLFSLHFLNGERGGMGWDRVGWMESSAYQCMYFCMGGWVYDGIKQAP